MHSQKQYIKFARILLDEHKHQRPFQLDLSSYSYEYVILALQKLGCQVVRDPADPSRVTVTAPVKPPRKVVKKPAVESQTNGYAGLA